MNYMGNLKYFNIRNIINYSLYILDAYIRTKHNISITKYKYFKVTN